MEIGGSSHNDKQEYDAKRDEYLKSLGLELIHYEDLAVKRDMQSVQSHLRREIKERERFLLKEQTEI